MVVMMKISVHKTQLIFTKICNVMNINIPLFYYRRHGFNLIENKKDFKIEKYCLKIK